MRKEALSVLIKYEPSAQEANLSLKKNVNPWDVQQKFSSGEKQYNNSNKKIIVDAEKPSGALRFSYRCCKGRFQQQFLEVTKKLVQSPLSYSNSLRDCENVRIKKFDLYEFTEKEKVSPRHLSICLHICTAVEAKKIISTNFVGLS